MFGTLGPKAVKLSLDPGFSPSSHKTLWVKSGWQWNTQFQESKDPFQFHLPRTTKTTRVSWNKWHPLQKQSASPDSTLGLPCFPGTNNSLRLLKITAIQHPRAQLKKKKKGLGCMWSGEAEPLRFAARGGVFWVQFSFPPATLPAYGAQGSQPAWGQLWGPVCSRPLFWLVGPCSNCWEVCSRGLSICCNWLASVLF